MIDPASRSFLSKRFDQLADHYHLNPFTHWVGRSELIALKEMIPPPPQPGLSPALDFGCGPGRVSAMLLEMGYRVTGYDLSPRMVEQAHRAVGEGENVRFTSDPEDIQTSWPLIVSLGVLDYYPDSGPLWEEWQRLSSPGGKLLVTGPNRRSPLVRFYTMTSRFTCQATATTLDALLPPARAAGFVPTHQAFAFPRNRWGLTLILGFRADGGEARG